MRTRYVSVQSDPCLNHTLSEHVLVLQVFLIIQLVLGGVSLQELKTENSNPATEALVVRASSSLELNACSLFHGVDLEQRSSHRQR